MSTSRRRLLQLASLTGGTLAAGAVPGGGCDDPSAVLSVMGKRQTVRRYKPDPVPDDHLTRILDAARRPPTCMNQQPWTFLVVRDKAKIEAMRKRTLDTIAASFDKYAAEHKGAENAALAAKKAEAIHFTEGYFTAPVYVVVLVDTGCPCTGYAQRHDGPMAAGYLMIAARAFGYGTAYLTDGIPEKVTREVLAIPAQYMRICITPIGVPDQWPSQAPKRKLEEMVAYETLEGHPALKPLPYNP
jgi:nicotinate-nucleotide--dimethylbenzimidazole phosphoribosyltransferase